MIVPGPPRPDRRDDVVKDRLARADVGALVRHDDDRYDLGTDQRHRLRTERDEVRVMASPNRMLVDFGKTRRFGTGQQWERRRLKPL
jgi:hypothetical protein